IRSLSPSKGTYQKKSFVFKQETKSLSLNLPKKIICQKLGFLGVKPLSGAGKVGRFGGEENPLPSRGFPPLQFLGSKGPPLKPPP
ncbi:MAG: hypothetical protein II413_03775, partial [Treponema sp.]|nr:hypothetical protein [Treponema sp.]